jgi:flagellar basal-body rod modification protein FlgD
MVSATAAVNSTSTASLTDATTEEMGQEEFLQLLIAQLQNQDPLDPVKNEDFVAELATFSSLEQEQQQTTLLEELIEAQTDTATSQALALIGKGVSVAGNSIYYDSASEEAVEVIFSATDTGQVPVEIYNSSGNLVSTDYISVYSEGTGKYEFSGYDSNGNALGDGYYYIQIGASVDSQGNQTSFPTYIQGRVDGVTFSDGVPILNVNGQAVTFDDVQGIFEWEE